MVYQTPEVIWLTNCRKANWQHLLDLQPRVQCSVEVGQARRHNISEKPYGYPKDISESCVGFHNELSRIWKQEFVHVCTLETQNVSDFSSQCFGYHISDIILDIRKAFRSCYDASLYDDYLSPRRFFSRLRCLFIENFD